MVNNQITAIFGLLFIMALTCTIGFIIWVRRPVVGLFCLQCAT